MLRMKLPQNCLLMSAVYLSVVIATRRRVPFMTCPGMKSNSDLMTNKPARSRIECSKFCLDDPNCLSASHCKTTDGYTCQLSGVYADGSCSGFVPDADCVQTAFVDPCENGGTFFPENRTCHCTDGFVGEYCHRYPRDCTETKQEANRVYIIQPLKSDRAFQWVCVFSSTQITYISKDSSNLSFQHPWQWFKEGVLPATWAYTTFNFCGLEYLHKLTSQGMYDMFVFLVGTDFSYGKLWYRNVRVDSEANGYSLDWDYLELDPLYPRSHEYLDGLGGAGDATKNLQGSRFGTFDKDVSGCSNANNAGWWYNPLGCMALQFEETGWSWPTNRSGVVTTELLMGGFTGIEPVFWYYEDDLVL